MFLKTTTSQCKTGEINITIGSLTLFGTFWRNLILRTKLDFGNLIINESKSSRQFQKHAYHPILK